jgi:hypothetical protein
MPPWLGSKRHKFKWEGLEDFNTLSMDCTVCTTSSSASNTIDDSSSSSSSSSSMDMSSDFVLRPTNEHEERRTIEMWRNMTWEQQQAVLNRLTLANQQIKLQRKVMQAQVQDDVRKRKQRRLLDHHLRNAGMDFRDLETTWEQHQHYLPAGFASAAIKAARTGDVPNDAVILGGSDTVGVSGNQEIPTHSQVDGSVSSQLQSQYLQALHLQRLRKAPVMTLDPVTRCWVIVDSSAVGSTRRPAPEVKTTAIDPPTNAGKPLIVADTPSPSSSSSSSSVLPVADASMRPPSSTKQLPTTPITPTVHLEPADSGDPELASMCSLSTWGARVDDHERAVDV